MWSKRAIKVAKALQVLGWHYILRDNDDLYVFENKPKKSSDVDVYVYKGMMRMLCTIMDMGYDVDTDTYQDYELWANVGAEPIALENVK